MDSSEKELYGLLRAKEIIAILNGDTKYGVYESGDGQQVSVAMPYLSGPDLCGLSTLFGLPVTYTWGGTNLSRWMYLDNLLDYCIKNSKCSDLLLHMFSIDRFKSILSREYTEDIEKIYKYIVDEIYKNINRVLYFGGHELVFNNNKYIIRKKTKKIVEDKQEKSKITILNKVEYLIKQGEALSENDKYSVKLYRSECESWMSEVNILNERYLKKHPLYDSIHTTYFHRKTNSFSIMDMIGLLSALVVDTEYWGKPTLNNEVERIQVKSIEELLNIDIQRSNEVLEGKVDESKARIIYTEITARYDSIIPYFGQGLYSYFGEQHFYDPELSFDSLKHNLIVLVQKMILFLAEKNDRTRKVQQEVNIVKGDKVFIVHGHDEVAKIEMARILEKTGFEAIILHEQADVGLTIIEKIEKYTDVVFAVVLYTECDKGRAKEEDINKERYRARQNVVFEHGYLMGKLGRKRVAAFVKGDVETPGDISGVVYTKMDEAGAWKQALAKNMIASDLEVDIIKMII